MQQMQQSLQSMAQPVTASQRTPTPTASKQRPLPPSGRAAAHQRLCWNCGSPTHVAKNCHQVTADDQRYHQSMANARGAITPSGFQEGLLPARLIKGGNVVNVYCVLDTGCNYTTVPKKYCHETIVHSDIKLYAANGEQIPILGKSKIHMYVGNQLLHIDCLVSEAVDEILLSSGFLITNNVQWDFAKAVIVINGEEICLRPKASTIDAVVRRVYVADNIKVEPNSIANVPVQLKLTRWQTPSCDWVLEPKVLSNSLYVPRLLMAGGDTRAQCV